MDETLSVYVCIYRGREREGERGGETWNNANGGVKGGGGGTRRSKLQPILRSYDCAKWYAKRFKSRARTNACSLSLSRRSFTDHLGHARELAVTSGFLPDTPTRCHTLQNTRRHTPLEISIRSKTRNNGWFEGINSSRDSRPLVTLLRYAVDLLLLLLLLISNE